MTPRLPSLQLVCFGPPTATLDGRAPAREVLWPKHLGLLIYLALSPGQRRSRDHLLGVFWGERPEDKARGALNETLSRLRGALGDARLISASDTLALEPTGLEVDALRVEAGPAPEDAVALARGEFLEGFHVDGAGEFEDWMMRERARYRGLACAALVAAGEERLTLSHFADAGDAARRAIALDPHGELGVRLLMRSAALAGDPAGALAAYHELAARLERDLGERPGKELAALAERIRLQSWRAPGGHRDLTGDPPPLVGQDRAQRDAFETVGQAFTRGKGPQALVITGPPGMGCSRLLDECRHRLALEGALVLAARPVEQDQDAPWSALRTLLRSGLSDAPGLPAARRESLAALAALVPELAERYPPRDIRDVGDMASALADVFIAVAQNRPIAVALDDAQWADGFSVAALGAAIATVQAPIALMLTVTQGAGDPPRELLKLLTDVGRRINGTTVRVEALSLEQLAVLVRALAPWCRDETERDRLTRRLAFETAGSPFFAVTLLHALAKATTFRRDLVEWPPRGETSAGPLPFSVPSTVHHALAIRLGELSRPEQSLLAAASVCGQILDLDVVAAVAEVPRAEIESALPAFERRHLITFDGRRYVFAAPLVLQVVRMECLPSGERRRLERRAIEALASREDLESRVLKAELQAHAAPDRAALDAALAAARAALEQPALRLARRALTAADRIAAAEHLDRTEIEALRRRLTSDV